MKYSKLIILGLVIINAFSLSIFFNQQQPQQFVKAQSVDSGFTEKSSMTTVVDTDIANFKTYENPTYGIKMQYPVNWYTP